MGEAKRRGQLGRQAADQLLQRVRAGDFGPTADGYLFMLDKSPAGQELLGVLRIVAPQLLGLSEALASDNLRLWSASPLFSFAVIHGGTASVMRRTRLAATLPRLIDEVLPAAVRSLRARRQPWTVLSGLSEPARSGATTALEALGGGE